MHVNGYCSYVNCQVNELCTSECVWHNCYTFMISDVSNLLD
jgi:hypothetical protein